MESDQALALGRLRDGLPDQVNVVVKDKLNDKTKHDTIARTGEYLIFKPGKPAFMLLDHDRKGISAEVVAKLKKAGGFWKALAQAVPAVADATRLHRRSTSAGLYNKRTKQKLAGSLNQHVYVMVKDGGDIERALKALHERLWLAGLGYYVVGAVGQLLDRSIIDAAVYGPERLVFEGKPELKYPVGQYADKRRPWIHTGTIIDTAAAIPSLSDQERTKLDTLKAAAAAKLKPEAVKARKVWAYAFAERTGLSKEEADQIAIQATKHILAPEFELEFDNSALGTCTVADILAKPKKYVGATLADPLEGITYGRVKAKVMRQSDGTILIHSFAHGGINYRLDPDDDDNQDDDEQDAGHKGAKEVDALIDLAADADLFHDDDEKYADIKVKDHRETWPLSSKRFQEWLLHRYYLQNKTAPSGDALRRAIDTLSARAKFDGPHHEVYLRIGGHGGKIYLDLCDDDWRVVEIDNHGWRLTTDAPVRFRRTAGMLPLPVPVKGGSVDDLHDFVNLGDSSFVLLITWLVAAFRDRGPYPGIAAMGGEGTAKSTLARVLGKMVDPQKVSERRLPREDRDLFLYATRCWGSATYRPSPNGCRIAYAV